MPRKYVDNAYNRQHGRVGLTVGSAVISKTTVCGFNTKTYVDNDYNRRIGRVGMPHGSAVMSKYDGLTTWQYLDTDRGRVVHPPSVKPKCEPQFVETNPSVDFKQIDIKPTINQNVRREIDGLVNKSHDTSNNNTTLKSAKAIKQVNEAAVRADLVQTEIGRNMIQRSQSEQQDGRLKKTACIICDNDIENAPVTPCGHHFCTHCMNLEFDATAINGTETDSVDEVTVNVPCGDDKTYKGTKQPALSDEEQFRVEKRHHRTVRDSMFVPVWRDLYGWDQQDLEKLKNDIDSYSPPHGLGLKSANILFIGPVGAGKSSFFNTVASVFRGYVTGQAICGSAEQSITSKYHMYRLRGSALCKPMKFRLCDTRGLEENQGIDATELGFLLDGKVPNGYQFNPSTPISPDMSEFISSPTLHEKIHCVSFIIDGSTAAVISGKLIEKIKSLQTKVRQKGIPQVVLVTKIDKVCSHVEEDVSTVFQSVAIQELVDKVSGIFGVPRSHVLPVKNYEKEINLKTHISILALTTLRQILRATEDYMFNLLDERNDKKKDSVVSQVL